MSMHHHHHHHTTNHLHHHHHFSHHRSSPSSMGKPTMANRGPWLAVSVLTSLLIIGAAVAFIVVFNVLANQSGFPRPMLIPLTIVPSLMIVIAIVSLVREIRIYKKIPSQSEGEPKEEGKEDDRIDEE